MTKHRKEKVADGYLLFSKRCSIIIMTNLKICRLELQMLLVTLILIRGNGCSLNFSKQYENLE